MPRSRKPPASAAASPKPYLVTQVGPDLIRVDFFSAVKVPHFVAHLFSHDEAMALAREITSAALNVKVRK